MIVLSSNSHNCSDEELLRLLDDVDLRGLVEREPEGFDALGDWDSTLSGGEKQRLAMTRLFYHAPQYALLDECTSAVSLEAEGIMYETAKKKGITLLTITHRVASLAKYHQLLLRFDGEGGWTFGPLDEQSLSIKQNQEQPKREVEDESKTNHYQMLHVRERTGGISSAMKLISLIGFNVSVDFSTYSGLNYPIVRLIYSVNLIIRFNYLIL